MIVDWDRLDRREAIFTFRVVGETMPVIGPLLPYRQAREAAAQDPRTVEVVAVIEGETHVEIWPVPDKFAHHSGVVVDELFKWAVETLHSKESDETAVVAKPWYDETIDLAARVQSYGILCPHFENHVADDENLKSCWDRSTPNAPWDEIPEDAKAVLRSFANKIVTFS